MIIAFTILGECASKANSRKLVKFGDRPAIIKSSKARTYEKNALRQIPSAARQRLEGPLKVTLRIYYASERPDLDESVVLDVLQDRYSRSKINGERLLVQDGVYRNDRQVREKHVFHFIDRHNPRAEIEVEPLIPQQAPLVLPIADLYDDILDKGRAKAVPF